MIPNAVETAKDAMLRTFAAQLRVERPGLTHARSFQLAQEQHPELAEEFDEQPSSMPADYPGPPGKAVASQGYRYVERPALVQCQASFELDVPTPDEIVYLPRGSHRITPKVNGVPKDVRINVDALAAERLQRDLAKRLSRNVRPHGGFDHKPGPASFVPKEFRWDPEKGVVLKVAWTRSGGRAVGGGDYAHFSPTFLLDGDQVAGLPAHGEIGSLVNSPAFDIPRIAASGESDSMPVYSKSGEFLGEVIFD